MREFSQYPRAVRARLQRAREKRERLSYRQQAMQAAAEVGAIKARVADEVERCRVAFPYPHR